MPQILAWQCPKTKKVFASKAMYLFHLKELAGERLLARREAAYRKEKADFFRGIRETVTNFEELKQAIFDNWERFCHNSHDERSWSIHKPFDIKEWAIPKEITFKRLRWDVNTSNSHAKPINGISNWCGKHDDKPKGYPGWRGSIIIEWNQDVVNFKKLRTEIAGSYFNRMGIETGTGSGGRIATQQEITLFAQDWPAMAKAQLEEEILYKLMGDNQEMIDANPRMIT